MRLAIRAAMTGLIFRYAQRAEHCARVALVAAGFVVLATVADWTF